MMKEYYYFKGNDGKFYVAWRMGQLVSGLFDARSMSEVDCQKWVEILNRPIKACQN